MRLQIHARFLIQAGAVVLGATLCGFASGQETAAGKVHPSLRDKWNIQLGVFSAKIDTSVQLDSRATGAGTSVNFEDDLGLADRETIATFLASVRLGERWRIEAEYFSVHRSNSRTLDRTIVWGGDTYPANTVVNSDLNSDTYRLSGGYSFIRDDKRELGVTLGLHVTDISATLSSAGVATHKGDARSPLPTIGIYGAYAYSPQWLLSGRLDYFSLNSGNVDGSLVNFTAAVEFRVSRHFGIGAGYRHVDVDVTFTGAEFTVSPDSRFSGPTFFVATSF
jgi:hypothetical protein